MAITKGKKDYDRFKAGNGVTLSRQEAIEAQCYVCNGGENVYCGGEKSCTLYQYSQFSKDELKKTNKTA